MEEQLKQDSGSASNEHAHPNPELATGTGYSPPRGNPFPIVGIGASAGGLEALVQLLGALPEGAGMAFVLVPHLDPNRESMLAAILAPVTRLPITTVQDAIAVEPGHIYVIPPNAGFELHGTHLRLVEREPGLHLPIDIFLRSLAQVQGSRAIGVILSGNASDGSLGLRAITAESGVTFAQDEAADSLNATALLMLGSAETAGADEVGLEVSPIVTGDGPERYFLVVFVRNNQTVTRTAQAPTYPIGDDDTNAVRRELSETREYLHNVREEYEADAGELRAANEEARSSNEELQSANEERIAVNEELHNRNRELAAENSDLQNLLAAVTVAVVMVDRNLHIKRFNTAAEELLELGPVDIGRPIAQVRGLLHTPRLEEQARNVIETLNATYDEIQDVNGCWYGIGVRPYRTMDERIAGVITFQDIDPLKRGLEASEEAREYAESLIETVRQPLIVLDADLRVQRATATFYETFMVSREETEGRFLYDLGNGQWNHARLRELLGNAIFKSSPLDDFEIEHNFPHIGARTMRLTARRIPCRDLHQRLALLAIEDVTERREIAEIRFQRLFENAKDGIVVIDVESKTIQDVNPYFLELTGCSREDLVGRLAIDALGSLDIGEVAGIIEATRDRELYRYEDLRLKTRNRKQVSVEIVGNRYRVGAQPVIQLNIRDISAREATDKALKMNEERFRLLVENVRDYAIFQLDDAGRIVTWNMGAERLLGWTQNEMLGQRFGVIFTPEDRERGEHERELKKARTEGRAADERWHMRKDGARFFASGVLTRAHDGHGDVFAFTKVMQDITARKEQEDKLRISLQEKSMLVREIHHRVKNNLQMIVSLLSLQSNHTDDSRLLAAFEETEARVRAIARIHEQLYAADDLTSVEIGGYLTALSRELVQSHSTVPEGLKLKVQADELVLPVEKAVPMGLIANELILNSLKHAFRDGAGQLNISLKSKPAPDGATWVKFSVEDSGPGLPEGFDPAQSASMGYQLVTLLAQQLHANLQLRPGPGASVTVEFPVPAP